MDVKNREKRGKKMITKIEIENFKSIEKATVELGKFNVLIGPNNSGKSNFIEACMLPKEWKKSRKNCYNCLKTDNKKTVQRQNII